jgi:DNA repair exonuclease SbcCD nuclease subunit
MYESFHIAQDIGCDKVIILGDLFDSAEPVGAIRNEVIDIFQRDKNGNEWGLEFYSLIGNHDIIGRNPNTIKRTALGTLTKCGINVVDSIEKDDISIYMGHYCDGIEQIDHSNNDADIYVLHANILPEKFVSDEFVLIDDFKVSQRTKLVVTGHYHPGYKTYVREDGVVFCNPGAIARLSAIKSNIERSIKVLVVDINGDDIKIKYYKLESPSPGNKIFNMEAALEKQRKRTGKKDLLNKLEKIRKENPITISENPIDDFKKYSQSIGISEDVIKLVSLTVENIIKKELK